MGGIVMTNDGNAILREAVPKSTYTTCMLEKRVGFCCFVKVRDALILFWRRETKTLEITKMPGLVKVKRAG